MLYQYWYDCHGQGVQKHSMIQFSMISQQLLYRASAMPDRKILSP